MIELIKTLRAHNDCDYTPIVIAWLDSGEADVYQEHTDKIKKHHHIDKVDDSGIVFFWCGPSHNWEPQYFSISMDFINSLVSPEYL